MRVFLTGNPNKPEVRPIFDDLLAWLDGKCDIVGATLDINYAAAAALGPDMMIVVGGDGTLIGAARELGDGQVPLAGVNVGKLGFLAEFSADELKSQFANLRLPKDVSERMMLDVQIIRSDGDCRFHSLAVNDCVVRDPFRMVRLSILLDGMHLTDMASDGVIVSTPTGSTAYNLAAGGPLLLPGMPAMVLTPICPHSLTFRPLVVEDSRTVTIRSEFASGVIVDGQRPVDFDAGDEIVVKRHPKPFKLVCNPTHRAWSPMRAKLSWGQGR